MAINYDSWKQTYSWMNEEQRKKYNDNMQAQWWDVAKMSSEYVNRFNQEDNNQRQTSNESNFNNGNGTNWQNQTQQQPIQQDSTYQDTKQNPKAMTLDEWNNSDLKKQYDAQNNQVSPDLDQTKFNQDPWKITVQEWTAQQTWKPDYWISTDARLNEMKGNLDHYFATSPRILIITIENLMLKNSY